MNLSFFIAGRYLLSKRKKTFINVISAISVVQVCMITAALIIVLSVFNGLEELLHSLNNSFDPEVKVQPAKGKSFPVDAEFMKKIRDVEGVEFATEVIEDYAYVRYRDANQVVTIKGVSDEFIKQKRIPEANITEGELKLRDGEVNYAVVGRGVQYAMSIAVGDNMFPLQVYYIKDVRSTLDPSKLYAKKNIIAGGVFSIVQQFDENYIIVPLEFAKELLAYDNRRTSIEIKTSEGADVFEVESKLQRLLGEEFQVLNHEEQHKDIYRLLKIEKLFTFLSGTLLLGVGSINIFFSLMMLALDKKKDISVLSSMGASHGVIRKVFLFEGALIAFIGTVAGLLLGALFCLIQQKFGIISMGLENAVMQGYPVRMQMEDFVLTLLVVAVLSFLLSLRPAVLSVKTISPQEL